MLHELVDAPGERDPGDLYKRYLAALAEVVAAVGVDAAADATALPAETLTDVRHGRVDLSLSDAAAILALDREPGASAIRQESLDHLLLGMTTAVLDVDALAANLDLDRSATELQQRLEGRAPMTLREYAHVLAFVESRSP